MSGILRFLRWAFWIVLAAFLLWVSISNRQPAYINFMLIKTSFETKVFVIYFLGIFTGLLMAGAVTGWLRLKAFVSRRRTERQNAALRKDMATLREDLHTAERREASATAVEQVDQPTRPQP